MIWRIISGAVSRGRNIVYRLLGVNFGGYVWMRRISIPRQWGDISLQSNCSLDDYVVLLCSGPEKENKLFVGEGTYINRFTIVDAHESISIGCRCMIGPHCYITDGDHSRGENGSIQDGKINTAPVVLEDNVWLGAGVIVLKGVRIGKGAVVGAGAIVSRDVESDEVVAGVPARTLGKNKPGHE